MDLSAHNPFRYFPFLIEHQLDQFVELLDLNRGWLDAHLNDLISYAKTFPEELQEEMFLDDVIAARDDLPGLTYSGFFLALFAFIEKTMRDIAGWCVTQNDVSLVRKNPVSWVSNLLTRKGAMKNRSAFKNEFAMLKNLRNACVHSGARLDSKKRDDYRKLCRTDLFSGLNVDFESGQIEFTADFVHAAVDWAKVCLVQIANDLAETESSRAGG